MLAKGVTDKVFQRSINLLEGSVNPFEYRYDARDLTEQVPRSHGQLAVVGMYAAKDVDENGGVRAVVTGTPGAVRTA